MLDQLWRAFLAALSMFWEVGWSLVLGFLISSILQTLVPKERIVGLLGREGPRQIATAAVLGAASSSCSYASASISRTLLRKGAGFIPAMAFLFSSTNLVIELGIVLFLLMGWQFVAAEWLGGMLLIAIMALLVKATYPRRLIEAARAHAGSDHAGHDHGEMTAPGSTLAAKLRDRATYVLVAQNFVMDWRMLWKDIILGFAIAGALAVFVPQGVWQTLFVQGSSPGLRLGLNALLGPLIAMLSFVCSIGNVPMAAVLWRSGVSFGGVLSFLFADLLVLPLLDVYRRYYGWRMAAYIAGIFYVTMAAAAIATDLLFNALGWVPASPSVDGEPMSHIRFAVDHTFWLNIGFGLTALALLALARRRPMGAMPDCCGGGGGGGEGTRPAKPSASVSISSIGRS